MIVKEEDSQAKVARFPLASIVFEEAEDLAPKKDS
jgi:hypothetical protein